MDQSVVVEKEIYKFGSNFERPTRLLIDQMEERKRKRQERLLNFCVSHQIDNGSLTKMRNTEYISGLGERI